jgi:hypothetical protein
VSKFFILVITFLTFSAETIFACSGKNQLHIVFTGNDSNVSHTQVRALSKSVFSDILLSEEIHTFSIDVNHAKGTMIFDVVDEKQHQIILDKINDYLRQNKLKSVRISYEKLLEKN